MILPGFFMIFMSFPGIFILLLLSTTSVRGWQDTVESVHDHEDESLECQKEKYSEKYNDDTESVCKKAAEAEEGECSASSENGVISEADCSSVISEENDQSDLVMLGQSFDASQDAQQSDPTQEDERGTLEDNADIIQTDENTNKESAKEDLDPEQENVPLREILLKLKVDIIGQEFYFLNLCMI